QVAGARGGGRGDGGCREQQPRRQCAGERADHRQAPRLIVAPSVLRWVIPNGNAPPAANAEMIGTNGSNPGAPESFQPAPAFLRKGRPIQLLLRHDPPPPAFVTLTDSVQR